MLDPQAQRGFKASETLLGIETENRAIRVQDGNATASKPLKPF